MTLSLTFPHDKTPEPGVTVELAPGVEWLRMPLPFALNHINLWLLADGEATGGQQPSVAVDTGFSQPVVKEAWQRLLASRKLTRLIVTHFHPDHLGLAAWLQAETAAPLWMSQGDFLAAHLVAGGVGAQSMDSMLSFFRQHGLDESRIGEMDRRGNSYKAGVPEIPATFNRLFDQQHIQIGAHTWRTIAGYGHAPEHMALYCDDLQVLISGDMLLPSITTNVMVNAASPNSNPLKWFLDSIERFRDLPENTLVLPSHGKPFRGLQLRLDQLHAHHANRCRLLREACVEQAHSAAELIPVLFDRPIPDPHQTMFAMGEAIAHLNYLEQAGEIRRTSHSLSRPVNRAETDIIRYQSC